MEVNQGKDEDTAEEIQARAADFLNKENKELEEKCKSLGIAEDLLGIDDLSLKMIVSLGENDVKIYKVDEPEIERSKVGVDFEFCLFC